MESEIMFSELLTFGAERVYIILYMVLFDRFMELSNWLIYSWFAVPNLLYFICFLWRISEKDPAASSSTKREEFWWMERFVFWIERILLLIIMTFGVTDYVIKIVACLMFCVSSLIYMDCFLTNFKFTPKTNAAEQVQKNDPETIELIVEE